MLVAVLLGLASTLHCLGMCGGIIGALTMSLPREVRVRRGRLSLFVLAYNLGRIASYCVGGALVATLGTPFFGGDVPVGGRTALQLFVALVTVGFGLHLSGWLPRLALLESVGSPIWKRLEPIGRSMLPVRSLREALLFGAVWGWLPCAPVYSALLLALSAGSAPRGAALMLAFGVGTLPGVASTGLFVGWLTQIARLARVREAVGLLVVVFAVVGFWREVDAPKSCCAVHSTTSAGE